MEIFARRIKLTRVTKENLQLKFLEVKGASCVRDPCNRNDGLAPNKPVAKHLPAFDPRMASSKSGHPESNQGPSNLYKLYSQMLYQLSYSLA